MSNRFVQAPSHGGGFRSGQPTLIVIHSLEAPARRGLAYDLATGWIQNEQVSPHSMTDPGETVDLLNLSTVGWHCGNGNQVGIGLEVTGYAAWSFDQWTTGDAFAAVRLDAKRAAEVAAQLGIPHRWLSLQQIRNGESGFCTHADISLTLGGTNHTDPGPGFPYAIFMQMVNEWAGTGSAGSTPPRVPTGTSGGAQEKTPTQIEEEELMAAKDDILKALADSEKRTNARIDSVAAALRGQIGKVNNTASIHGYSVEQILTALVGATGAKVKWPSAPVTPPKA